MPTLLEKIEASAAAKLGASAGRKPALELARYKNFMKVETHRLQLQHRAGAGGREICRGRAFLLDTLFRYLAEAGQKNPVPGQPPKGLALVAIGGYGRAELNPASDIDLMFLYDNKVVTNIAAHPCVRLLSEGVLFDLGLRVGHSVRTLNDCVEVANQDMMSKTSLLESRLIWGDAELFTQFQVLLKDKCILGHVEEYIKARLEDQAARRAKFGNNACMQEPNVKNGCGGLRDYQNLVWMAYVKHGLGSVSDFGPEIISATERNQLETAYDFLLRVRNDMHYHLERGQDILTKNIQPGVAHRLGYRDRSPRVRLENLMRDYYKHARNIYLITRTAEQRLAILPPKPGLFPTIKRLLGRKPKEEPVVDGFKFGSGQVEAANPRVFDDSPRRLMRAFLHAQQRGLELHPDLIQLMRQKLALVDRSFQRDPHVRDTFLQILNQRGNVAPVVREMHDVGLLGKYIPEFGRLTNLVQHEFFHQFATDEHILVCLEKLDLVWDGKSAPYKQYTSMLQSLEKPYVLYLALLLHDAGKAEDEESHTDPSVRLAQRVAQRLALEDSVTKTLCLVIENHLTMSQIALRRDLEDPKVIRDFAACVQTEENLRLLTLHTFADTLGTSDKLWNGFKDTLMQTLFVRTSTFLKGERVFIQVEERQRELLALALARSLPKHLSDEELHAHFKNLPARYFQIYSVPEILADLELIHRFMLQQVNGEERVLEPLFAWHNDPDRGCTRAKICTWDRARLFSKLTGTLSAAGLNILTAQIFTRDDGVVLDTFEVIDARTGGLAAKEEKEKFESLARKVLAGSAADLRALIIKQQKGSPRHFVSLEGDRIPTRIVFDNDTSDTQTVIEVETEDRLGLLHAVSRALAELDLGITVAKICTEKGAALDSFYVLPEAGGKITSEEAQQKIREQLEAAIAELDRGVVKA